MYVVFYVPYKTICMPLTLFSLQAMLLFIPGGKTSSPLTVLLMQGSVPFAAVLSAVFFGARFVKCVFLGFKNHCFMSTLWCYRYTRVQAFGLLTVTTGLILALVPTFEEYVFVSYTPVLRISFVSFMSVALAVTSFRKEKVPGIREWQFQMRMGT